MATKNSIGQNAVPKNPMWNVGKKLREVRARFSITSGNSAAGDILILAGPLTLDARIAGLYHDLGTTPALTSASDNDLGFYKKKDDGTLIELDKDILWDGVTLASAITGYQNLLSTQNTALDTTKSIGQLLGLSGEVEPSSGIFLCLTMNAANTATGPLILDLVTKIEEATTR